MIPNGYLHHAKRGEVANISCDPGFEPRETIIVCDREYLNSSWTKHEGYDLETTLGVLRARLCAGPPTAPRALIRARTTLPPASGSSSRRRARCRTLWR